MSAHPTESPSFDPNDTVVLAAVGAVFVGALVYAGVYDNFLVGALWGVALMAASLGVAWVSKGAQGSRLLLPALGMAMVGLMIHVARGHNEAHFAVFAFLACLTVYRRAVPILVGAGAIAVHHLSFNYSCRPGAGAPSASPKPSFLQAWLSTRST